MEQVTLNVEGMSCSHCENVVKKAVGMLPGVKGVQVSLEAKTVTVQYSDGKDTIKRIKSEIEDQGYEVVWK